MEPVGTKHPVRTAIRIVVAVFAALALFVALNPFGLGWCSNLQWKVSSVFSFIYDEASRGEEIGDSSGVSIIPVTYDGAIDLQAGLELVSKIDEWSEAEYVASYEKLLESGGKAYVYLQSVNGRVVMGSSRILLVDAESKPMYIVNDAANQAYTTAQLSVYKESGITLEEVFDEKIVIKESMPCWYDTGRGLVAAKHVVFTCGADKPVMAALIEECNRTMGKLWEMEDSFDRLGVGHDEVTISKQIVKDYYDLTCGLLDGSIVGAYEETGFRKGDVARLGMAELWYQCDA